MTKINDRYKCSLELTHNIIGGKWKLRILWHIFNGDNRFSTLKRVIPNITEKVLYTNLRELETHGIIYKESRQENTKIMSVFYYLNEEYSELEEIIYLICKFSRKYASSNNIEIDCDNLCL